MSTASDSNVETISTHQAVGRRVHHLMWDRKLTARAVAPHLGMDPTGLGRRIRGERGWDADDIFAAAHFFDVSADYLLGLPTKKAPTPEGEGQYAVVPPEGFEPPTSGTGNQRSIP